MAQILAGIPLDVLSEDHLKSLVLLKVGESAQIEYKERLQLSTPSEKREFCKDVSAMANSQGGYILFGIREEEGVPAAIPGIDCSEPLQQQVSQVLTSGIVPRMQVFSMVSIPVSNGRHVLCVRLSPDGYLHQVKYDDNRYYKRTGTITVSMDSSDVEAFFKAGGPSTRAEAVRQRIDDYHKALRDGTYIKAPSTKAVCTVCITPEVASCRLDLSSLSADFTLLFQPVYCSGWNSTVTGRSRFTFDGDRNERTACAVTELTEMGEIRAYNSLLLDSRYGADGLPEGCAGYVPSVAYELELIIATHRYLNSLVQVGVAPPFLVNIALINVRTFIFWVDAILALRTGGTGRKLAHDDVLPEAVRITGEMQLKSREEVARTLRPAFDFVWREFGYERSYNYTEKGDWQPER